MKRKKYLRFCVCFVLISSFAFLMTGCSSDPESIIDSADPDDGYSTTTSMSSLEYSQFLQKQITIFVNLLESHMDAPNDLSDADMEVLENNIDSMQESIDTVQVTMPSKNREEDREAVLTAMEETKEHLESYRDAVENGKNTSKYSDTFLDDFDMLTGLSNAYIQ